MSCFVLQMLSTLKDHKDNVGGIFNRYDILKVKLVLLLTATFVKGVYGIGSVAPKYSP